MPDNIIDEAAGSAIAAFTIAQMSFWAVYNSGLLTKDEAEKMLKLIILEDMISNQVMYSSFRYFIFIATQRFGKSHLHLGPSVL